VHYQSEPSFMLCSRLFGWEDSTHLLNLDSCTMLAGETNYAKATELVQHA